MCTIDFKVSHIQRDTVAVKSASVFFRHADRFLPVLLYRRIPAFLQFHNATLHLFPGIPDRQKDVQFSADLMKLRRPSGFLHIWNQFVILCGE